MYTTGNPAGDALVPVALTLVDATRRGALGEVYDAYAEAQRLGGPWWQHALVMVLAAMVPDDRKPSELLAWCSADRDEYLRLRGEGVDDVTAARAARLKAVS